MPRSKEPRMPIAGIRLKLARKATGKTIGQLLDWQKWKEIVDIFNESTISRWERHGIPETKVSNVAKCFSVPAFMFLDASVSDDDFRKCILLRMEDPNADLLFHTPDEKKSSEEETVEDSNDCVDFIGWLTKTTHPPGGYENSESLNREDILRVFENQIRFYFAYPERYGQILAFPESSERDIDLLILFPGSPNKIGILFLSPEDFQTQTFDDDVAAQLRRIQDFKLYRLLVFAFAATKDSELQYQKLTHRHMINGAGVHWVSPLDTWNIFQGFQNVRRNPFKHLNAYTELDTDIFFGRKDDVQRLLQQLTDSPATTILGESGVGKTSLIRAGLLHGLSRHPLRPVVIITRMNELLQILEDPLNISLLIKWKKIKIPDRPSENLIVFLKQVSALNNRPIHLIVDQFEEIFHRVHHQQRETFFHEVIAGLRDQDSIFITIVIRADFFYEMSPYRHLHPGLWNHAYRLDRLDSNQASEVIIQAMSKGQLKLSSRLCQTIVKDFLEDNPFLPYLQIVCYQLFEKAKSENQTSISVSLYNDMGGVEGIINDYFNGIINKMNVEDSRALEVLLPLLIEDGYRRVMRADSLKDLYLYGRDYTRALNLIYFMIESRIIMRTDDAKGYILTHDIVAEKLLERQNKYAELTRVLHMFHNRDRFRFSKATTRFMIKSAYRYHFPAILWEKKLVNEEGEKCLEDYLIALTQSPDFDVRHNALRRMAILPCLNTESDKKALENRWQALKPIIDDENESEKIRSMAISAAGALNHPEVVKMLSLLLTSGRELISLAAVRALARINTKAAINNLSKSLVVTDQNIRVIQETLNAITISRESVEKAIDLLDRQLSSNFIHQDNTQTIVWAANLFSRYETPKVIEFVRNAIFKLGDDFTRNPDSDVSRLYLFLKKHDNAITIDSLMGNLVALEEEKAPIELCDVIGALCDHNILDQLVEQLRHESWFVRENALNCIRFIEKPELLTNLYDALEVENKLAREQTDQAVKALLIATSHRPDKGIPFLIHALGQSGVDASIEAFLLLSKSGRLDVTGVLKNHLQTLRIKIVAGLKKIPANATQLSFDGWYDEDDENKIFKNGQEMISFWASKKLELFDISYDILNQIGKAISLNHLSLQHFNNKNPVSEETMGIFGSIDALYQEMNSAFDKRGEDRYDGPANYKTFIDVGKLSEMAHLFQALITSIRSNDICNSHDNDFNQFMASMVKAFTKIQSELPVVINTLHDWNLILETATMIDAYHICREYFLTHVHNVKPDGFLEIMIESMAEYCPNAASRIPVTAAGYLSVYKSPTIAGALLDAAKNTNDPEFICPFIESLANQELGAYGEAMDDFIISPYSMVRIAALNGITKTNPKKSVKYALKLLDDTDGQVVEAALTIIECHGDENCIDTLVRLRERSDDKIRDQIFHVLSSIMTRLLSIK